MYEVVRVGWVVTAVRRSIKLRYYVKTAAGKVVVNWILSPMSFVLFQICLTSNVPVI